MAGATTHTIALTAAQADSLERRLRDGTYELHDVAYARVGARKPGLSVTLYVKGPKVVVQGKESEEFIRFVLEPEVMGEARLGYEAVLDPEMFSPHIGVDESGKGDYFGPLVVAGVYTDEAIVRRLVAAGVTDSKKIGTDRRIRELAELIVQTPGIACDVVEIPPARYNGLHAKIGNVNKLLAWGHARVIENLLERRPDCPRSLSDQFAANPRVLTSAMLERGRKIRVEQRTKAEADVAVAAASILARERFVRWLERAAAEHGVALPKGAGPQVVAAGREWVRCHGKESLENVAKIHFKTSSQLTC